jgi:Domain of unknown function (DUF4259)
MTWDLSGTNPDRRSEVGAWGIGIFEDDSALDFLTELTEAQDPLEIMNAAFVSASGSKYLEYEPGHRVLVSAAALDALLNGTRYGSDLAELDDWVQRNQALNVASLKVPAVTAVRRVLAEGSELKELWVENEKDYPTWRAGVESLAACLAR